MNNPKMMPVFFNVGADNTLENIKEEASGKQLGLYSRFETFNKIFTKYFRFKQITIISGNSGGAKSYLKSMLKLDFTDNEDLVIPMSPHNKEIIEHLTTVGEFYYNHKTSCLIRPAINKSYSKPVLFIDFTFEMSIEEETLRLLSIITGYNTDYLQSALLVNNEYQNISSEVIDFVSVLLNKLTQQKQLKIFSFPISGTVLDIQECVLHCANLYPDHQIVTAIDHTLLTKKLDEKTDFDLHNNLMKTLIETKLLLGKRLMQFLVVQMNSDIEDEGRRTKPALHYPIQSDIYAGTQLYFGADNIIMLYNPSKAHIEFYGVNKIPTVVLNSKVKCLVETDNADRVTLIHGSILKNRSGKLGHTWFLNKLDKGKIVPITRENDGSYVFKERLNFIDYLKDQMLGELNNY